MVNRAETMKVALDTIYKEMKLEKAGIAYADCRWSDMKVINNVPVALDPYDGDRIDKKIEESNCFDAKHLLLATRCDEKDDDGFVAAWQKELNLNDAACKAFNIIDCDPNKPESEVCGVIKTDGIDVNPADLRKKIAKILKMPEADANKARIAVFDDNGEAKLWPPENISDIKLTNGCNLYVKVENSKADAKEWARKLNEESIEIRCNKLGQPYRFSNDYYTLPILMKQSAKISELREKIKQKFQIKDGRELIMRDGWKRDEITDKYDCKT